MSHKTITTDKFYEEIFARYPEFLNTEIETYLRSLYDKIRYCYCEPVGGLWEKFTANTDAFYISTSSFTGLKVSLITWEPVWINIYDSNGRFNLSIIHSQYTNLEPLFPLFSAFACYISKFICTNCDPHRRTHEQCSLCGLIICIEHKPVCCTRLE